VAERFGEVNVAPSAQEPERGTEVTDEAIDTEFEDLLRTTLHEMVPKLLASTPVVEEGDGHGAVVVGLRSRSVQRGGSRRTAAALLACAVVILGLIVIATRKADEVTSGDSASSTAGGVPAWYDMIKPSLPDRFPFAALTFATDAQLFFVAVNPTDGKTLEIQLASNAYSTEPTTIVDATGAWVESDQGWSVKTPSGLFVSVTCNIGVGGRDYVGPTNYCDMASAGAFTKADIHAVANSLATSLTLSIFDAGLRVPTVDDPIDIDAAEGLARSAFPGVKFGAGGFGGSDEIISSGMDDVNPSGTAPALSNVAKADTSIRLLSGLYPTPTVSDPVSTALYEDAAVIWQFGSGGVLVRISTTDPTPQSDARLQQLAQDIVALIPTTPDANPTDAITLPATTTTVVFAGGSNPAVVGVVVVDASDRSLGSDFAQYLQANGVQVLSVIPATISSPETMLQPLEDDSHSATQLNLLLQVSRFDTFTPTEIDGELPKGATVVVVLGADGGPPTYRGSVNTTNTAIATTTIVGLQDVPAFNGSATTTTASFCDSPGALPTAVVANASRVNDTATWWTNSLGVNVVDVHFADPVNAVARSDHSRVVALNSSDCEARKIAEYTTGTSVDFATADELQALVLGPLPLGTSIVVLIGNDNLSQATTGVTTTSNGF
jgi:hypothetical protein